MVKLSICVPHYKESWEICKPLFDSIAVQKGIDLTSVEVVFVNDGEKTFDVPVNDYPFLTSVYTNPHKGVSAARNRAMDEAIGEYVMFCDCDDYFCSMYGLHLVYQAMENDGFDALRSAFIEEQPREGTLKLYRHDDDCTFVHGKVYRKSFLTTNELRWNEELTVHEDGYFNSMCLLCSENTKQISTPFYTWHWNEASIVRSAGNDFLAKTYPQFLKVRTAISDERFNRGYIAEYMDGVTQTVLETYYDVLLMEDRHHITRTEVAFKKFWNRFKPAFRENAKRNVSEIADKSRQKAVAQGLVLEKYTVDEWLDHIEKEIK